MLLGFLYMNNESKYIKSLTFTCEKVYNQIINVKEYYLIQEDEKGLVNHP